MGLAFSRDGRLLASTADGNSSSEALLWDLDTGRERPAPESNLTIGGGLALSPDARHLAANLGSAIKVWDVTTGKLNRTLSGHLGYVHGLAFSPDGRSLASCGRDSTVRVWDLARGEEKLLFRGHVGRVTAVAYSPDGSRLVSGGSDGTVKVWDTTLHPEYASLHATWFDSHMYDFEAMGFGADGRSLTLVRQRSNRLFRVDPTEHAILSLGAVDLTEQWLTPAEPACLDAGGRWLAGVSREAANVVKCWDAQTDAERVVLRGHTVPVWHVAISPGGGRLATGSPTPPDPDRLGEVKVWDGDTGRPLLELAEEGLGVTRLALSPTGDRLALAGVRLATASGQEEPVLRPFLTVYAVEGGRPLQTLTDVEDLWYGLAFSGDGRRLAACGGQDRTVLLWDLETGRRTVTRNGPLEAGDVAFSPDGRRLAVGGRRLEKLLDAVTGEELLVLRGEAQRVRGTGGHNPRVRWSPDGRQLAANCGDSVSVWSVAADNPEERVARLWAAGRRAEVDHLATAYRLAIADPSAARFHLDQVRDVSLGGAWEQAYRGLGYARMGEEDRADADYAQASRGAIDSPMIEYAYGTAYATVGRWEKAATHVDRYFRLGQGDPIYYSKMASLPLYRDDPATYRRYARFLLDRHGQSSDTDLVVNLLLWGLLAGENDADPQEVVRMADRCLEDTSARLPLHYLIQVKAMAEYRAGHLEAADGLLRHAEQMEGAARDKAVICFFLAMSHQRQNRGDEAKAAYQQGLGHAEREFGGLDEYQPGTGIWYCWTWCQAIRREAEATLAIAADSVPPER